MKNTGLPADDFFLVTIPALDQLYFIGYKVGSQLYLAPVLNDMLSGHGRELVSGAVKTAEDYFQLLQPEAALVDENVPDSYPHAR